MSFVVGATELGTPEAAWLACPRLLRCAPMQWGAPGRVVMLAPHPDDEVLPAGGLLQLLAAAGFEVHVVAITDGESSHPRARITPSDLAARRAAERDRALGLLCVQARVTRLGCADGGVDDERLAPRLAALLQGAALCLSPWQHDGHPDHDATGRAAAMACAGTGTRHVQLPIWAWHWGRPDSDDLPWERARRVDLPPAVLAAKRAAIAAYRTQIGPLGPLPGEETVLPSAVLARFVRPFEIVLT